MATVNVSFLRACRRGDYKEATRLLSRGADPNVRSGDGWSALHHACRGGNMEFIKTLCEVYQCNTLECNTLECKDVDGWTPLHEACGNGYLKIAQYLVSEQHCNPQCTDILGQTPLHLACREGHLEVAQYLVSEQHCNPQCTDNDGETPLHYACREGHLEVAQYLVSEQHCNPQCTDNDGATPLHYACWFGHLKVAQYLVSEQHCNPQCTDNYGRTPLHLACLFGHLKVAQYLVSEQHCNPQCTDNYGRTPLHLACLNGHLKIAQYLVSEQHCNPQYTDDDGETPLHLACRFNQINVAMFLLSIGCDPNHADNMGHTPLSLTNDTNIIRGLLHRGAKPTTVYHQQTRDLLRKALGYQPDSSVKMFVVGDVGAGKSTLTAALKKENKGFSRLTSRLTQVSGVEQKTAGIIPHEIASRMFGRLTLYDLAGHKEYYASHDTVLRSTMTASSEAVFLLVADLAKSDEDFRTTILYWLTFIDNLCTSTGAKPHIIVIGSHVDAVSSKVQDDKKAIVDTIASGPAFSSVYLAGFVAMDCRYSVSSSMSKLCECLAKSCESLRDSSTISFQSHCFLVYLVDQFRDLPAVTLSAVLSHIQQHSEEDETKLLVRNGIPTTMSDLHRACEELNKRGNLLFIRNPEDPQNSWLILDKEALLTLVTGSVFAPQGFKQHHNLASSTGVVPLSNMATHFPKFDPNMLAHFFTHLEFCYEVRDKEVLKLLAAGDSSSQERHFFFPSLVQIEASSIVWETSDKFDYHCGWLLQCSQTNQFFLPRFHHVLLLRLAFSFALSADTREVSSDLPTLKRKCTVWKNGISWANRSGVEAVVEVVERRVTVVLRCLKGHEMECVRLRSALIQKVVQAKEEFCPKVSVTESFIHPSDATQYPPKPVPELKLFSLAEVASSVAFAEPCIVGAHGPPLPLEELLHFEPYADLGESILKELFDKQNSETDVKDEFLYRVADQVYQKKDRFIKLFKLPPTSLYENLHQAPPGPTHALVRVFQLWRLRSEGTYQFSVFAGRNPLAFTEISAPTASPQ